MTDQNIEYLQQQLTEAQQKIELLEETIADNNGWSARSIYRQMFERHSSIQLLINPQTGEIIDANEAATKFYGYSLDELKQLKISQINMLSPDEISVEMNNAKAEKRTYFNFPHRLASGTIRQVEVHSGPIDMEGKRLLFSIIHDITDRREMEETLRESQRSIQTLLSSLPGMAYRCRNDNERTVIFVSQGCYDLTGYAPDFLVENGSGHFVDLIHLDDQETVLQEIQQAVEQNEPFKVTYRLLTSTGAIKWVWEQGQAVIYDDGNLFIEGFISDITQQKKAEIERGQLQRKIIEAQRGMIQELLTPIIPIVDRVIVLPVIGTIDANRARDLMRTLLQGITEHRAKVVILDITGVPMIDADIANHLDKTIHAARLKGAQTIITGISDAVAETVIDLGIDWSDIETVRNLQAGLMKAIDNTGYKLSKRNNLG